MINSFLSTGWAKNGPVGRLEFFFLSVFDFSLPQMY